MRARSQVRPSAVTSASASGATPFGSTKSPVSPSGMHSGVPPTRLATTGVPAASASSTTSGKQDARSQVLHSDDFGQRVGLGAVADDSERQIGHARREQSERVQQPVYLL